MLGEWRFLVFENGGRSHYFLVVVFAAVDYIIKTPPFPEGETPFNKKLYICGPKT